MKSPPGYAQVKYREQTYCFWGFYFELSSKGQVRKDFIALSSDRSLKKFIWAKDLIGSSHNRKQVR